MDGMEAEADADDVSDGLDDRRRATREGAVSDGGRPAGNNDQPATVTSNSDDVCHHSMRTLNTPFF